MSVENEMERLTDITKYLNQRRQEVEESLHAIQEGIKTARARQIELIEERRKILETPITKADFIDYVLSEIDRHGAGFPDMLASQVAESFYQPGRVTVAGITEAEASGKRLYEPLCGNFVDFQYQMNRAAIYFVFADEIKEAVRVVLEEKLLWDFKETISRQEAASRLEAIDKELAELQPLLEELIETARKFGETVELS